MRFPSQSPQEPPSPTRTDPDDDPRDPRESRTLSDLTSGEQGEDRNLTLTERLYVDYAEGRIDDETALRYLLAAVAGCQDDVYADERENEGQ